MCASAISVVMVKEEKGNHRLIYYIIRVLQGAEVRYFTIKKFAYTVITAAKKKSLTFKHTK